MVVPQDYKALTPYNWGQDIDPHLNQGLVDSIRDVCFIGSGTWLATMTKLASPSVAVEAVASAKVSSIVLGATSGTWEIVGKTLPIGLGFMSLLHAWCLLRDLQYGTKTDYLFPGAGAAARYSAPAARKKMGRIFLQIRGDESLKFCGVNGGPTLADALALHLLRGGSTVDLPRLLKYLSNHETQMTPKKDVESEDLIILEENIPQPKEPIKTVVFGGHPEFIERKYAPALLRYGLKVIKNYPFNTRGRKNVTLPVETDLVLVVKDMVGHSGSSGSYAAIDLARAQGKSWVSVPRKLAQAVTLLRGRGFIPTPQVGKIVKEEAPKPNPVLAAHTQAWELWRKRRVDAVMDGPSVLFTYKERQYRVLPCPTFEDEAIHPFDTGRFLVVYLSEDGPVYCSKQTKYHRVYAAAEIAWANRTVTPVDAPVVVPPQQDPVGTSQDNTVILELARMFTEEQVAPPVKKAHPYDDLIELAHMLTDTLKQLGCDSVLVGADGSLSIYRASKT